MNEILHILDVDGWAAAQATGTISSPSLATEGFVHCSTRAQVARVIERFYAGIPGLLVAVIDGDRLGDTLRWEPPAHPDGTAPSADEAVERFPHVYDPIPVAAVVSVEPWP